MLAKLNEVDKNRWTWVLSNQSEETPNSILYSLILGSTEFSNSYLSASIHIVHRF